MAKIDSEEIWKDIPEFEGLYQVSNKGRIRSVDRVLQRIIRLKGRILNPYKQYQRNKENGYYLQCAIYKNNIGCFYQLHRLVAEVFLENENPLELTVVNHKDGDKTNNTMENLEWVSVRENCSHSQLRTRKKDSTKIGASWNKQRKKWKSSIRVGKKKIDLGTFSTEEEAAQAYQEALKKYKIENRYAA